MGFHEELARIATDPDMFRRALGRARSRELAEDAMQETVRAIAERRNPTTIENLPGFFYVALMREIDHQLGRPAAIPAADIGPLYDRGPDRASPATPVPPASVHDEVRVRILAQAVLERFEREHARAMLIALVPARSDDPRSYRTAVVSAARAVFELLLDGHVTAADWNAILKAASPQWCGEPGLARATMDQRLSRARRDVQALLRSLLPRDQLAS
jgi:DNA-directed RNA polymerase specialized sigma24 family protein